MERRKNKESALLLFALIMLFLFIFTPFGMTKNKARAEEIEPTQSKRVIEGSNFLTFRKGDNEKYGRFIFACFYVLDDVYDESCEYGTIIFPKRYLDKLKELGATDNYIEEFEKYKVPIINISGRKYLKADSAKIFKFGLVNILEQNVDREFAFIFYVMDDEGNTEYAQPQISVYNKLIVKDYTDNELKEILNSRLQMDDNFKKIVEKIEEFLDSVWIYMVIGFGGVVVVWGAYIGIKIAIAKKKEEQINAKGMIKSLVIGITIMFLIAVTLPILINGLAAWVG